ncbi:MAG: glycosyl hydrolase family 8 [Candidatus Binatia bacterium]|nr:glycosyl hydrolase family 8 [Candidatus Binatia bacterium]
MAAPRAGAVVNHPFGSRPLTYAAGTILPNHLGLPVLDQAVRDFYDAWKAKYVSQQCGAGRYLVEANTQLGNLTVSEGQGYGMVITAMMAGHDPTAQTVFDGMYAFFRDHPTAAHANLMSWYQNDSCDDAQGNNSASDGDLDIAFALLLADEQWGSAGAVDYASEALAVIADIKDGDTDTTTRYVTLGDWVTPADSTYYPSTRTSDFMMDHYRSFEAATSDSDWAALLDQTYTIIAALQAGYSPATGLLPDFVLDPLTTPVPAGPGFLEGSADGAYSYNAARDPWRIATDYIVSGDERAKTALDTINTWLRSSTSESPAAIQAGYQLNGTPLPGTGYISMAFIAPFGVGAMVDVSNQAWLNDTWDLVDGTSIEDEGYFENTLKMLSMLVMSGNWWAPALATCGDAESCTIIDACDGAGRCVGSTEPAALCTLPLTAGRSTLVIKEKGTKDSLVWKWSKGPEVLAAAFGDPTTSDDYTLCLYDETGGSTTVLLTPAAPAGSTAWVSKGDKGFLYKKKDLLPDGIRLIKLAAGTVGKAKITFKAKGEALGISTLGFDPSATITAQLRNSSGACFGAVYQAPFLKNEANQFRDRSE